MAFSEFAPEIWSKSLNLALTKSLVSSSLVNQDYQGDASQGKSVNIVRPSNITVKDYDPSEELEVEDASATSMSFIIQFAKYFNFHVEDIDAIQANMNYLPRFIEIAKQKIRTQADKDSFEYMKAQADSSNVIAPVTLTKSNILEQISYASELLDENDVPEQGRVMVISPKEKKLLIDAKAIPATQIQDQQFASGIISDLYGFKIYVSNQLFTQAIGDVSAGQDYSRWLLFGHPMATTFASQVNKVEAYRVEKAFKDGVKGLYNYGLKTIEPLALGVLKNKIGTKPA